MRIVIDECVPRIAKRGLPSRSIVSVQEMGWAGVKNGKLLKLVADEFDVFITSDRNLRFQTESGGDRSRRYRTSEQSSSGRQASSSSDRRSS